MEITFITLIGVIVSLLVFISIEQYKHSKETDKLINKIMSKDYREYYLSEVELMKLKEKKHEKPDPKLGNMRI
jgi:hypothetical protein